MAFLTQRRASRSISIPKTFTDPYALCDALTWLDVPLKLTNFVAALMYERVMHFCDNRGLPQEPFAFCKILLTDGFTCLRFNIRLQILY